MSFADYTILEPGLLNPETGTAKGYRVFHQVRSRNRRSLNQQICQWFRDHPEGVLLVKFDSGTWFLSNYRPGSREEILGLDGTYRFLIPDPAKGSLNPGLVNELWDQTMGTVKGYQLEANFVCDKGNEEDLQRALDECLENNPDGIVLFEAEPGRWLQSGYPSFPRADGLAAECTYRVLVPETYYSGPVMDITFDESPYSIYMNNHTWPVSGLFGFGSEYLTSERVIHKQGNEVHPIFGPQQGEQTMMSNANYSIAVLKKQLLVAKDKHVNAIKDTTKAGASELDELMKRFKDTGTATCTEEPIMLPTSPVTAAAYDEALGFLDLLAGDTVESTALPFNPVNLLRNAGKFDTGKRFVEVRSFA